MVVVRKKFMLSGAADRLASFCTATPTHVLSINLITCDLSGHINHSLFWKNLAPSATERKGHGGQLHDGPLKKAIYERWGSYETFTKEFNTTTAGIQGSGWGWLVRFDAHSSPIGGVQWP